MTAMLTYIQQPPATAPALGWDISNASSARLLEWKKYPAVEVQFAGHICLGKDMLPMSDPHMAIGIR